MSLGSKQRVSGMLTTSNYVVGGGEVGDEARPLPETLNPKP